MWDMLLTDCHAATMTAGGAPYGLIRGAAIAIDGERIAWIGKARDLPQAPARETHRLDDALVTPGLIDCHTHLVFGGNRAREWEARLAGASYEEIAAKGGGIVSTVHATRAASEAELAESAAQRAAALAGAGVTTAEIKSGYGLDVQTECKILRAAAAAGEKAHVRVMRTLLGAHVVPPEYQNNRARYVDLVCHEMIPTVARDRLADAVDVFCDTIAFTVAEAERIFAAAMAHELAVKMHAGQLSDQGAAALAGKYRALSADHLEHVSDEGIAAMAAAGTVAVLLPCAWYFLGAGRKPPIPALRKAGVRIAVATDCNPGTSPVLSPLMAMNMACTSFGLTPEEALAGMTRNAAAALGLQAETGTLEAGKSADLAVWKISNPAELAYWMGAPLLRERYLRGRSV
ncbi:MAG: imidazolonepropionase [Alphaproteobacteria bacterium]|nr:imidazolonepropionase [Alphaproteobacteria bacterium]